MRKKRGLTKTIKPFWQSATGKSFFIFLVIISFALMIVDKLHPQITSNIRINILNNISLVYHYASQPVNSFYYWRGEILSYFALKQENERLKIENDILKQWRFQASKLIIENEQLQRLTNLKPYSQPYFITAKIIAYNHANFNRSMIINAGSYDKINHHNIVVDNNGLVGRVVDVGDTYSKVLLITDNKSNIPVKIEGTSVRAIMQGDNIYKPKLLFLDNNATADTIHDNALVMTSGHGKIFPAGIPIGYIIHDKEDDVIRVDNFLMQNDDLVYVHIIKNDHP